MSAVHPLLTIVPGRVIKCADGSFLAVAPPDAPISCGAFGATEQEARVEFRRALHRMVDALDGRPPKETRTDG